SQSAESPGCGDACLLPRPYRRDAASYPDESCGCSAGESIHPSGGKAVDVSQETKNAVMPRAGWHEDDASAVAQEFGVDFARGLSVSEARSRLESHGPNRLASAKKESGLQAFLRQYRDFMQIILLGAAVINLIVTGDAATSAVLAGLTVFNAVIG